jgi:hypothetical protein
MPQTTLFPSTVFSTAASGRLQEEEREDCGQRAALADDLEVIEHSLRIFYRNYFSQPLVIDA